MRSNEAAANMVTCICSYKCSHTTNGYDLIPSRTKRKHMQCDQEGKIHPIVARSKIGGNIPSQIGDHNERGAAQPHEHVQCSSPIEPETFDSSPPNANQLRHVNTRTSYLSCTCSKCRGNRVLHRNSVHNHLALDEFHARLQESITFSSMDGINMDYANVSGGASEVGESSRSQGYTIEFEMEDEMETEMEEEQGTEMGGEPETEAPRDTIGGLGNISDQPSPTPLMLHDAILTKLVSLQSTMDTYKLSQNLQITLLKEVFDKSSKPDDFSSVVSEASH